MLTIDEGGFQIQLLGGDDSLHHGFDFAFEVVALVDHVSHVVGEAFGLGAEQFMKDAEDLVGIDGAQGEVVVGVAAVVEVETAQESGVEQPSDDLLDVLRGIVMPGIDQHAGLRPSQAREVGGHAPVGDIGVIKSRLEGFVFDEQPLLWRQMVVAGAQGFLEPADALAHALCAGIVGAIGHP